MGKDELLLSSHSRGLYELGRCLVVPLGSDFTEVSALSMKQNILNRIARKSLKSTILDLSDVAVLDRNSFSILAGIADMIKMMGAVAIFVGFRPGVASALVELGEDTDRLRTAFSLEEGLEILKGLEERPW